MKLEILKKSQNLKNSPNKILEKIPKISGKIFEGFLLLYLGLFFSDLFAPRTMSSIRDGSKFTRGQDLRQEAKRFFSIKKGGEDFSLEKIRGS